MQAALRDEALSMEKQHTGRSTSEKGPKIPPPLHTYLPPSSSSSSAKGKETEADKDKGGNKEGSGNVSRLLNFTVDSTFMYNVFREFPAVKRAYQENVPDKIRYVCMHTITMRKDVHVCKYKYGYNRTHIHVYNHERADTYMCIIIITSYAVRRTFGPII